MLVSLLIEEPINVSKLHSPLIFLAIEKNLIPNADEFFKKKSVNSSTGIKRSLDDQSTNLKYLGE